MNFADHYFSRYHSHPRLFNDAAEESVGIVVVIPCYDDELIFSTLQSLSVAHPLQLGSIEVIVIVNSGVNSPLNAVEHNRQIFAKLKTQSESGYYQRFNLFPFSVEGTPKKIAGVGFARKMGMDEAVRRFADLDKPRGIIVSLDADCLVSADYFQTIEDAFRENPQKEAFTFGFQHDFDPSLYSQEEIEACRLYEMYLRYYRSALHSTGFPYSFHTIGSCFAVTALAYTKVGGMPSRQGGEDFYFLHKLAPMNAIGEIADTLVYPSPRISDRVPFGTGPSVQNIIADGNGYKVYNYRLFDILRSFFDCFEQFAVSEDICNIPHEIINFVGEEKLLKIIAECRQNARQGQKLTKRLFSKFDAFFIVKFLNSFDENSAYPPVDILEAVDPQ
jgi:hypothetical protein